MPLIVVRILEGRPPDKIAALIAELTEATHHALGAPKDSVRVIVEEVPKTHWGIGGQSAQALGR
jgi:4-oxalocrotonate tautomerase